jgi:hypothetical protein
MRPGEAISAATFLCFMVLGRWRLQPRQRHRVLWLGLFGLALVLFVRILAFPLPAMARRLGDWLPNLLLLVVYWQSGHFARTPNQKLQAWLERFDQQRLGNLFCRWQRSWSATWLGTYFELAYLLCYSLIPLGVGVLYLAQWRAAIDAYWATVLPATFFCYLVIPFAASIPPRLVEQSGLPPLSPIRSLNLFILRHASIQINTFPSAHVASTTGASLVLLRTTPLAGIVFLVVSLSIAAGAVLGRYHFAPDVMLGFLVALFVFQMICGT